MQLTKKTILILGAALIALGPSPADANLYGNVAVVAQTGGDYATSLEALANIAEWCPDRSATSPCLIKVSPGVYTEGVLMLVPFLDIEGSGANVTKIVGKVKSAANTVNEIRSIAIENSGTNPEYAPVYCYAGGASITLKDVVLTGTGTPGLFAVSVCTVTIDRSVVTSSGATGDVMGVQFHNTAGDAGSLTITDSTVSVSGGTNSYGIFLKGYVGGPVRIRDTSVSASGATGVDTGIMNTGATGRVELDGLEVVSGDVGLQLVASPVAGSFFVNGSRIRAPTTASIAGGSIVMTATRLEGGSSGGLPGLSGSGFRCFAVHSNGFEVTCP